MPRKRVKGGAFERDVCRKLSLWWSGGRHDDLCWRTAGSGGRATNRHRKGQRTIGHCGDITNTSPDMEPFFRILTVECKRGYNTLTPMDFVDGGSEKNGFASFVKQAVAAAKRAGAPHYLLIHRRDSRVDMAYFSEWFYGKACGVGGGLPSSLIAVRVGTLCGNTLDLFLRTVEPDLIREMAKRM